MLDDSLDFSQKVIIANVSGKEMSVKFMKIVWNKSIEQIAQLPLAKHLTFNCFVACMIW